MLLLHLSDLHLSRYGENRKWQPLENSDEPWELQHSWQGWRIEGCKDRKNRPFRLRLIDPAGIVHHEKKWPQKGDDKVIAALLGLAMKRHATSADELIRVRPGSSDLASLLRVDPHNSNLRFMQLVEQVLPLQPEIIALTGDITDNGLGYNLVEHYLRPWIEQKRLLAVPGNHDTYEMFPGRGRKARLDAKMDRYRAFAQAVDMVPGQAGAWARFVGDFAFVGLSSCKPPVTPLSASGEVTSEQLAWMIELASSPRFRDARQRIVLMHHHLLRMPFEFSKGSPIEVGLRLRNAKEVMNACTEASIDVILHGHRHHGYSVKLPGHPLVVSSPSSTLGCKFTGLRYVWTLRLDEANPFPVVNRFTAERAPTLDEEAPEPELGGE